MFYDKRRVSTQISRLCHLSHYFVWCEETINVMFTLETLLGCVYVQLLTYEDVYVYISLT